MKIVIETIPHKDQRYVTCGDWYSDADGTLQIRVSDLGDWRMEALIGIHEAVEALLCRANKVKQADVDTFDTEYENVREASITNGVMNDYGGEQWRHGKITMDSEPGDHPAAPYGREHCYATSVERMLCAAFGIAWSDYEESILAL